MKKAMDQSKLITLLNIVSLVALLVVAALLFIRSGVSGRLNAANEDRFNLTYNANRFMNGSAYLTNEVRAYAATGNQVHYDNYWNEINVLKNRDEGVAALQEIGITAGEQAMIEAMSALSNQLVPLEENAMEDVQAGRMSDAVSYVYGDEYTQAITEINSLKEQFLVQLDTRTKARVDELTMEVTIINLINLLAIVVAGMMQVLIMLFTKRRILQPVIEVRDQMGEISQGNLSADFPLAADTSEIGMLVESIHETKRELKKYIHDIDGTLSQMAQGRMDLSIGSDYRGEFRPIQQAMSQILDALNAALSQINQTATRVTEESERMASDAQILSDGAVEQASTVQELSASIQTLASQVGSTSADADDARRCSADMENQLNLCSEKMDQLTKAMSDISASSQQISGIIKTIEDIAFQTNILALNAAVEAARAGTAGKGFSVVADEVRNLASKSDEAAKATKDLIGNSINAVENGTSVVGKVTESLQRTTELTGSVVSMMESVTEAVETQTAAITQVTEGIDQISAVVQTNSATSEECAAASEELSSQANIMHQLMAEFHVSSKVGGFGSGFQSAPASSWDSGSDREEPLMLSGGSSSPFGNSKY